MISGNDVKNINLCIDEYQKELKRRTPLNTEIEYFDTVLKTDKNLLSNNDKIFFLDYIFKSNVYQKVYRSSTKLQRLDSDIRNLIIEKTKDAFKNKYISIEKGNIAHIMEYNNSVIQTIHKCFGILKDGRKTVRYQSLLSIYKIDNNSIVKVNGNYIIFDKLKKH